MDNNLLLVKTITLLYKETTLEDKDMFSARLATEILDGIKLPDVGSDFDRYKETLVALRGTTKWLIELGETSSVDKTTLLQRIRVNVGSDEWLYEAFRQGIDETGDSDSVNHQVQALRRELTDYLASTRITDIMKRATHKLMFQPESIPNVPDFIRNITHELEPFLHSQGKYQIDGEVDSADFADPDSVYALMAKGHAHTSSEGVLKFGYQAFNRMLGINGGGRRGECCVVSALQHNFKSGWVKNMFKHMALYNVPFMKDPSKKPCLVFLSLEDELPETLLWYYVNLKENETRQPVDMKATHLLSPAEQEQFLRDAAQYVIERLSANGYHIIFKRIDPSSLTYDMLFEYLDSLKADGYEIHALVVDYLAMMSKRGLAVTTVGSDIRDLWRRTRNYTSASDIFFVSPHQMSPAAKLLVRGNVEDLVKEVANKGYYDGCSTLDQEVDLEVYLGKVKVNGNWYLTVQRGKHRGLIQQTPERDLYFVLPFNDVGGICDDINGQDTSSRHAGAAIGEGDSKPWFS